MNNLKFMNIFFAFYTITASAAFSAEIISVDNAIKEKLQPRYPDRLLELNDINLVLKDPVVGEVILNTPDGIEFMERRIHVNCTSEVQLSSFSFNLQTNVGSRLTLTKGLSSNSRKSFTLNFSYAQLVGVTSQSGYDIAINSSTAEEQSTSLSYTISENLNRQVLPKSIFTAIMKAERRNDLIKFDAEVIAVSGTVKAAGVRLERMCSGPVVAGVCIGEWINFPRPFVDSLSLESILSEDERTFNLEGQLRTLYVSDVKYTFEQSEITQEEMPHVCGGEGGAEPQTTLNSRAFSESISTKEMTAEDTIGPADGITYQVLYVEYVYRPTPACGFNDLGLANPGKFQSEAREYSEHVNGKLVRKWQEKVEGPPECVPV